MRIAATSLEPVLSYQTTTATVRKSCLNPLLPERMENIARQQKLS